MSDQSEVSIALTPAQVARVVQRSAQTPLSGFLAQLAERGGLARDALHDVEREGYSRSTLRALMVLSAFPVNGAERELTDVANELSLSPSTTHRYIRTWTAIGLLERDPDTRRYRRTTLSC